MTDPAAPPPRAPREAATARRIGTAVEANGPSGPADVPEGVRRRLDEVFGEVLPDVTRDERDCAVERPESTGDEWLRANRPPHHDESR